MLYSLLFTISSVILLMITNNLVVLVIGLELAILGLTCGILEASVLLQEPLGLVICIIFLILAAIDTALGLSILVQYLRMKDESSFEQAKTIVKASFNPFDGTFDGIDKLIFDFIEFLKKKLLNFSDSLVDRPGEYPCNYVDFDNPFLSHYIHTPNLLLPELCSEFSSTFVFLTFFLGICFVLYCFFPVRCTIVLRYFVGKCWVAVLDSFVALCLTIFSILLFLLGVIICYIIIFVCQMIFHFVISMINSPWIFVLPIAISICIISFCLSKFARISFLPLAFLLFFSWYFLSSVLLLHIVLTAPDLAGYVWCFFAYVLLTGLYLLTVELIVLVEKENETY